MYSQEAEKPDFCLRSLFQGVRGAWLGGTARKDQLIRVEVGTLSKELASRVGDKAVTLSSLSSHSFAINTEHVLGTDGAEASPLSPPPPPGDSQFSTQCETLKDRGVFHELGESVDDVCGVFLGQRPECDGGGG